MLPEKKQVLIVDDEPNLRKILSAQLARDGYDVITAEDGEQGLGLLKENHIDLVITDLKMPKVDGMTLLREALREDPDLPIVMITAHGTVETAVEALKIGAFDYLTKPFDKDEVRQIVGKALKTKQFSEQEATRQEAASDARFGIIGTSAGILEIYAILERVADTPTTVLITGESGTGKELVARALHENSSRKDKPFIKVNCAAIPKELIESELFGYERGAFTGAVTSKPGRVELANGGTLFLDEIGEVPVEMQVKLLRALQESEFERVGGIKTIRIDVRLVAATNRDLKKLIASGNFREDLFYRLNVLPIHVPPLRRRREDISLLVEHFIAKVNKKLGAHIKSVEPEAMKILMDYDWPGNVRELENTIERAVVLISGDQIQLQSLPPNIRNAQPMTSGFAPSFGEELSIKKMNRMMEEELILKALKKCNGNRTRASEILEISHRALLYKMKEYSITDDRIK